MTIPVKTDPCRCCGKAARSHWGLCDDCQDAVDRFIDQRRQNVAKRGPWWNPKG